MSVFTAAHKSKECIKLKLKYLWPDFYAQFFKKELLESEVNETKATCHQCVKAWPQYKKSDYYLDNLKCCTFQPYIPNYAIGAILSDPSDRYKAAQEEIRKKIKNREYMLPVGLVAPIRYQIEYVKNKKKIFGRDENFLCAFYDQEKNQCGAWQYRGAVCTSFYCVSSYGKAGKGLWDKVSRFQTYVEIALMEEAMVHLGYSPRQLSDNLKYIRYDMKNEKPTQLEKKSWVLPEKTFANLWGDYRNQGEDFYKNCYKHVKALDVREFREAIGNLGQNLENELYECVKKL